MTNRRTFQRAEAILLGAGLLFGAGLSGFAQAPQLLYSTNGAAWSWRTDNFQGSVGALFTKGASDVVVTNPRHR